MNVLQQQLDISKSLLASLDNLLNSYSRVSNSVQDQSSMINNVTKDFQDRSDQMDKTSTSSESLSNEINRAAKKNNVAKKVETASAKVSKDMQNGIDEANRHSGASIRNIKSTSSSLKTSKKSVLKTTDLLSSTKELPISMRSVNQIILDVDDTVVKTSRLTKVVEKITEVMSEIKDAVTTGGFSLVKTGLKALLSFARTAFNVFTSLVGGMTKMFLFATTLPFTIAKIGSEMGNKIRRDLVEVIQTAGEDVKNTFDLTSNIGKNADKMTKVAKGMLKTFQSPRSRLAKLFGMGAQGAATFLRETTQAISDMGHYAEIFGPSIFGSTKNGQYLIEMQRAMGLGAQEMAYYALESYNAGIHPVDTLHKTSQIIKNVAEQNDLDFKALSKDFHGLRTNITDFGHLTSNEIGNLVGKLRKMKVKAEDAVNVFKKFTSFDEAAKSSAMLFQTFEMNIDAFDLLTARDPGEMLTQFRDSMFQTGKNFKDLNRHEKSLMASITGISEHGLSTLMNYMDLGLTQDEARKRMEEEDPTTEQTKMMKGLSSTIKLFQKTLTFDSPFQAFFQGLTENSLNQNELQSSLISLSEVYSDIRHLGFTLDLTQISAMLSPITEILRRIDMLINGNKFKKLMTMTTSSVSRVLDDVSYDIQGSKTGRLFTKLRYKVEAITKLDETDKKIKSKNINNSILISLNNSTPLAGLNTNVLEALKKGKVIKQLKDKTYEYVKDITIGDVFSKLASLSENSSDPKVQSALAELYKKSDKTYNTALTSSVGIAAEEINNEANKRTSVKGRIDNLYDDLLSLFKEGTPHFSNFVDLGGNMMGSILRGFLKGLSAGFFMLSGATSEATKALGLTATDEIKKAAADSDMSVDDYSILNHLGITEVDSLQIQNGLGTELMKIVKKLPSMASMASSVLGDLMSCFAEFAVSVLGVIGEMSAAGYDQATLIQRHAMDLAGFNPEKARYAAAKAHAGDYTADFAGFIGKQTKDVKGSATAVGGSVGDAKALYEAFLKYYPKESHAYKFLSGVGTRTIVANLTNRENFKSTSLTPSGDETAERMSAMSHIFSIAKQYETLYPNQLYIDLADKNSKINKNQRLKDRYVKPGDTRLVDIYQSIAQLKKQLFLQDNMEDAVKSHYKGPAGEKYMKMMAGQDVAAQKAGAMYKAISMAQDVSYTGKNAILETPTERFILDDHDSVLAAKKGGFLNKVFIEVTDTFNDHTAKIIEAVNATISDVVVESKATIDMLKQNIVNVNDVDYEAEEEDFIKIFEAYDEVISIISNREIVAKQSNLIIEA